MEKMIKYLANDFEDAVIRVIDNGDRYVKFFKDRIEFKANPKSNVAYGTMENSLIEISKNDYNTFGISWHFGGRNCERTNL
jgi:hypothetical protein